MHFLVMKQFVIMIIIAAAGFIITRAFKFGKTEQNYVSTTLLYFINPCLIIDHFNIEFDASRLKSFAFATCLSIVVHLLMMAFAVLIFRSKTEEEKALDCLDRTAAVFTNCGFIGIPLIHGVLGTEGVFYLLAYVAVFNVMLWTLGYALIAGKPNAKKIITNPNILCVLIGIVIFCLPFKIPEIIATPIKLIGGMNTATAMILLGMLFANFKCKNIQRRAFRVIRLCFVRHILFAFVALLVVFFATKCFPKINDLKMICTVVYIAALCPVGMSVSSMAVIFDRDESYSALLCLCTSIISVITLPASVALAEHVLK